MFNVDTTVKNNRKSLFRQLISRHLWKQVTLSCDFNFAVLDSQNLFLVNKLTV